MEQLDELWDDVVAVAEDKPMEVFSDLWQAWARDLVLAPPATVTANPEIWEDSGLLPWVEKKTLTHGGATFASHLLKHPSADIGTIHARQDAIRSLPGRDALQGLRELERDVLWLFKIPADSQSLQLLFPQTPFLRAVNLTTPSLSFFHIFRSYISPALSVATPLTTIFGPYLFMRRQLGMKMPLVTYFKMLFMIVRRALKPSGDHRQDAMRLGTLGIYFSLYLMGILQSFQLAKTIRYLRGNVLQRLKNIRRFVATFQRLEVPPDVWKAFGCASPGRAIEIPQGIRGMYCLLRDDALRGQLRDMLIRVYILDACCLVRRKGMTFAKFVATSPPRILGMRHPALPRSQTANPLSLDRSLVITGPNAAGKSTFMRSACANIVLAQTFGVVYAKAAVLAPFHVMGSFMRINDTIGSASLFEAETRRCGNLISRAATAVRSNQNAVFFMDEPMHSTPPIEGAATSIAAVQHIGTLPNVRVMVTTHYFALTRLASSQPTSFHNVSMEALPARRKGYRFPFRIRAGPSFQCIAIELLRESGLPAQVIASAMDWKNKLCSEGIRTDA